LEIRLNKNPIINDKKSEKGGKVMSDNPKTNKLSIYLIKEEFKKPGEILKDIDNLDCYYIDDNGTSAIYTKKSKTKSPQWITSFFCKRLNEFNLFNSSSQAIFLINVEVLENVFKYFALPFGSGHFLLKDETIEERFGLKTVLNTVDEKQIRSIDKKNMAHVPKHSREQMSLSSFVSDFGIDIEQDMIVDVRGKAKDDFFGKTISGKDSFKVSVKADINSIEFFLKKCFEQYEKKDYESNFGWIDQISEIKNSMQIEKLNRSLVKRIKSKNLEKLWMAIPEIIDWADVEGFSYQTKKSDESIFDDIYLQEFLQWHYPDQNYDNIDLDTFKKNKVYCHSASTGYPKAKWPAFNCLYCENEIGADTFLLTGGKWYQIQTDFVKKVNSEFKDILEKKLDLYLPDYDDKNEEVYNQTVSKNSNFALMDRNLIPYGEGYNKIEFCDLYSKNREIVHVKRYGNSSVLSHLFFQGVVSGELFIAEKEFRDLVNKKLPITHQLSPGEIIKASEYKIIFAIISQSKKELNIPFFSKVSLKTAKRRLETIGYKVFLKKINTVENCDRIDE